VFLLFAGWFLLVIFCLKISYCSFKWKDDHTVVGLVFTKDRECLWNTKSEHYTNQKARKNALQENCVGAEFSGIWSKGRKFKIKIIRTRYAAGLPKVRQPEEE
jgi:hypothetical protein